LHPVNKIRNRNDIVKEDIQEQFVNLVQKKGKEIEKKISIPLNNNDTAPSQILTEQLIRKIIKTEDINTLTKLGEELLFLFGKQYKYIRTIAKGGEAVLILANNVLLNNNSIFKVARPFLQGQAKKNIFNFSLRRYYEDGKDNSNKKRFIRGASLQRNLSGVTNYGYIPAVYTVRENPLCVEMEYIDTESFEYFVDKNNVSDNLEMFYYLLKLIEEIHSYGVIHRDIKPSNILVNESKMPVLLDFTTAKQITEESENLTTVGFQIGTKSWSSPKQMIDAGKATFADDIFSLGLLLYVVLIKKIPAPLKNFDARKKRMIYLEDLETTKGKTKYINRLYLEIPDKWKNIFKKSTAIEEKLRYTLIEEMIKDVNKILGLEDDATDRIKKDYSKTIIGSCGQYLDLEKKYINLEIEVNKIKETLNKMFKLLKGLN